MSSGSKECGLEWRRSPLPDVRPAPDAQVFRCVRKAGHDRTAPPGVRVGGGGHTAQEAARGR